MDSNSQRIRLSDQMSDLYGRNLTVINGSRNSNFNPGLVVIIFIQICVIKVGRNRVDHICILVFPQRFLYKYVKRKWAHHLHVLKAKYCCNLRRNYRQVN